MLVAQKAAAKDEPSADDMFSVGCVSTILQLLKLPDGTVKVLVEGLQRAKVDEIAEGETHFTAIVTPLAVEPPPANDSELEALRRAVMQQFDQYVKLNKKIPPEILTSIASIDDMGRLVDTIAAHLPLKLENKQAVLELHDVKARLEELFGQLEREVDILNVDKKIRGRVKRQMEKNQRDFYLNEQVKAIQKELGEGEEGADIEEIEKKIKAARMPADARKKADGEFKKLKLMSPMSAEATVVRNYIDVLTQLPWSKKTKIKHDLAFAEDVLNRDHFGLEKVKDRILEYLAVQQRVDKVKAPILCLVGPPGVGKTSLGQSVAKATGRKYVRMALGGMRDEAEIRGHRRTYIGAMPGKVLQSLTKVGTKNPLFLLDEIDKLGTDFRGDPSSALLEVLDPEQNGTFRDNYLGVPFDLSRVVFMGHSAGGHLAAWAGARARLPQSSPLWAKDPLTPSAVVTLAGINDLEAYHDKGPDACGGPTVVETLVGFQARGAAAYADTSPPRLLPLERGQFVVSGALDPIVPPGFGEAYGSVAIKAGDPVQVLTIPESGHFELIDPRSAAWAELFPLVDALGGLPAKP